MIKVFNQPFIVQSLMALVFFLMPVGSFAQDHVTPDLEFYNPTTATNYEVVTEWIMNWTDRKGSYPALHNSYQLYGIEYSSSNTAVATINVNDGTITPIAPGKTTITASFPGEGMYDSASASYTLTYNDNREKFEILGVSFSEPTCEATYGDATVNTPSLEMGKLAGAAMTYSSSTNSVATVDNAGAVTIKGVGSTVISASFAGDDDIKPGSVSYTLTVHPKEVGLTWGTTEFTYDGREHVPTATATGLVGNDKCTLTVAGAQTDAGNYTATASALSNANYELPAENTTTTFTINKADAFVTFAERTANVKMGEDYEGQTATTAPSGLTLEYTSSNTSVATVNESTGAVTLVAPGSATIKATFAGGANYNAAEASYTLTVTKADPVVPNLSFASETATATFGDAKVSSPTLNNPDQLPLSWSSSKEGVATVNSSGAVTIKGAGKTVISAAFAGNDTYSAATISYTLTVNKADATVTFAERTANVKMGEDYEGQTATTAPSGLTLEYTSSNTSVATVNESTGAVTLVSPGSATIKATFAGGANYNAAEASYTLTVTKADPVVPNLSFASETATATFGDAKVSSPTLNNPDQLPLSWSSSKEGVATVNSSGAVTIKGAGKTVISAAFAGNDTYSAATISYTLTVNKADATVTFAERTANVKMGEDYEGQTATTAPSGLTLEYTSSNTSVATVNESTGAVTLVSPGSTTIKATFAGDANYNAAEASYTLTVSKADAVDVELSFASDKVTATYGDDTVSAPSLNNPKQLPLTWSSSNVNVATIGNDNMIQIVGAGQTVISAAFTGDDTYQAKTVSFTLSVNKADATVTFASKTASGKMGEAFTAPKVTTTPADLTLAYTSSNTKVATVDSSTGALTLVSAGETTITATFAGNDNYNSASDSYTLVIEASDPTPEERLKLEPIVKEVDYTMDESDFINADGSEVDLSNTIVNNILFTLKNQESSEGDGYDTDEHCIVINTVTLTSTVNTLIANGVEPGSSDYASQFTGMTFIVPAGEGYIIVTSQEAESIYLMVKVGNDAPVAINMLEMGDYSIPYKSNAKTYVYLWNGGTNANGTRGKKSMPDTRVRRVTYKSAASDIQQVIGELPGDERWYNLNGLRITRPTKKGVYIHGSRKVVIK